MPKRSTLRLTTRSVAALPVTGKDTVYWDRDLAGFGVRVQRNGRKVYVVQSRGPAGLPPGDARTLRGGGDRQEAPRGGHHH